MSLDIFSKKPATPSTPAPAPATPATPPARTYTDADIARLVSEAEARGRAAATKAPATPATPASGLSDDDVRRIAAALRGSEAPATPAAPAPAAPATPAPAAPSRPATTATPVPAPAVNPTDAPMTIGAFEAWQRANRFEAQAHVADPARADKADRILAVVDSRLSGVLKWFDGATEHRSILTWNDCWEAAVARTDVKIGGDPTILLLAENGNGTPYELTRWRRNRRNSIGLAYETKDGDLAWCPSTNEKKILPVLVALIAALP